MPNLNPNSTLYVHSHEPNTNDLTMAMTYNSDGEPCIRFIIYTENGAAVTYTGDETTITINEQNIISVINLPHGKFSRSTDQTALAINEGVAVSFDTTEIANGISFNGGTDTQIIVSESGFYQFDLSAQVTATSNKGIIYFWFRKNEIDIPNSTRASTITNGDTFNISTTISISLAANDYVEIMWAKTANGIFLDAVPATAFAPSAAAVMLNVTQTQL